MISKDKVMLQIPVKKEVAKSWKELLNQSKIKAEDLFTAMYGRLLLSISGKVGDENAKNKDNKEDSNKKA